MAGRPLRRSQPGRAGIPWREFLDMPLAAATHLAAAAHRANGGREMTRGGASGTTKDN